MKINNPLPAAISRALIYNFDMTLASGAVQYFGFGFRPTRLDVIAVVQAIALVESHGFCGSAAAMSDCYTDYLGAKYVESRLITLTPAVGATQYVDSLAFNPDGATLNWTKVGSPTGTAFILIMASK